MLTASGKSINSNEEFSTFVKEIIEEKQLNKLFVYDMKFDMKQNSTSNPKISQNILSMLKNPKQETSYESKISLAGQIYCFIREEIVIRTAPCLAITIAWAI